MMAFCRSLKKRNRRLDGRAVRGNLAGRTLNAWMVRCRCHPAGFLSCPLALRLECNGVYLHGERGFDPGLLNDILALLKRA
jgi:hypothetical protein